MQQSRLSFYEEIRKNKIYSVLMITTVFIILIGLGYVIALAVGGDSFFFILILAVIISISYVLISYYNSDKIALASVNAKKVLPDTLEYRQYHNLVEGLALASGLPKPELYI